MGKIRLDLRVSQSKYFSSDPEYNRQFFDITKKYLQMILDNQKYLFLETALAAYGFEKRYPEYKLRSAWFAWDKRNKIHVYLVNHKILERKNTRTGKKYYKNVQSIVFEVCDNSKCAEEYAMVRAIRPTIKKHEFFRDYSPTDGVFHETYTGPVPC